MVTNLLEHDIIPMGILAMVYIYYIYMFENKSVFISAYILHLETKPNTLH